MQPKRVRMSSQRICRQNMIKESFYLFIIIFCFSFFFLRMIKEEAVDVRGLGKSQSHFHICTIALLFTYTNSAIAL